MRASGQSIPRFCAARVQAAQCRALETPRPPMPDHDPIFRSEEELAAADRYEVADYKRVAVTLASGLTAWVYVRA